MLLSNRRGRYETYSSGITQTWDLVKVRGSLCNSLIKLEWFPGDKKTGLNGLCILIALFWNCSLSAKRAILLAPWWVQVRGKNNPEQKCAGTTSCSVITSKGFCRWVSLEIERKRFIRMGSMMIMQLCLALQEQCWIRCWMQHLYLLLGNCI